MKEELLQLSERAEKKCADRFRKIDHVAQINTERVLDTFRSNRVAEACFAGTTGYGYDDLGRDTLDRIYAELLGTEAAVVRIGFVNGTHALASALFALARPGETLLSVTGLPYDTLQEAIGIRGDGFGSLKFYGIGYRQIDLAVSGGPEKVAEAVTRFYTQDRLRRVLRDNVKKTLLGEDLWVHRAQQVVRELQEKTNP